MKAFGIDADIGVHEDALDDLSKGQCDDGQVVTLQLQDRDADQKAEECRQRRAADHRDDQTRNAGCHSPCKNTGHTYCAESADTHKPCLPEVQFSGNTHIEVEADGGDHVTGDRNQQTGKQAGQTARFEHDLNDDVSDDHDRKGQHAPSLLFIL